MSQKNINHGDHPAAATHPDAEKHNLQHVVLPAANFKASHPAAATYAPPVEEKAVPEEAAAESKPEPSGPAETEASGE